MKSALFFIAIVFLYPFYGLSQSKISASLTPGIMYYMGDLKDNPWPEAGYTHFTIGADIGYRFSSILNLTFGYAYGNVSGADSLAGHTNRNLHFKSVMHDIRLLTYIDLIEIKNRIWKKSLVMKYDWKPGWMGPELIIGVGLLKFNPKGYYNGEWHELQPLGTEGQNLGGEHPSPYSLWQFNVKFGLGLGYAFSKHFNLGLHGTYSFLFTDYLDDASDAYPDYNQLIANPDGEKTAHFTYGGNDGSQIEQGTPRANPDRNDGYVIIGLKLTYVFSKSELQRLLNFKD